MTLTDSRAKQLNPPTTRLEPPPGFRAGLPKFRQPPEPISIAETAYESKWEEFINSMGLENEPIVRAIITEWEQFNQEIQRAWRDGDITRLEMAENRLSNEDLQERLAPYLTSNQLVDIGINNETFREYVLERHNSLSARRDAQGYNHPLLTALISESIDSVQALIDSGADVNFATTDGDTTPLGACAVGIRESENSLSPRPWPVD